MKTITKLLLWQQSGKITSYAYKVFCLKKKIKTTHWMIKIITAYLQCQVLITTVLYRNKILFFWISPSEWWKSQNSLWQQNGTSTSYVFKVFCLKKN